MNDSTHVAVVDDDMAILDALRLYFRGEGVAASCFESAAGFLAAIDRDERFDCVVSDVRMPGMSGLELVHQMAARHRNCPIILITGHGDVDMAVSAIKSGAFDFLEKPFDESRLLGIIRSAARRGRDERVEQESVEQLLLQFNSLSPRQRQVMEHVATGMSNKDIGARLNISPKTVENHRAWVMERMGARNVAELVQQAIRIKARSRRLAGQQPRASATPPLPVRRTL